MGEPAYDALLCDLDGVVRFYDLAEVHALEQDAGLARGSTMAVAFAPETDLPLLLGRISRDEWVAAIAGGLAGQVTAMQAQALARAFGYAPSSVDAEVVALLRQARERMPVVIVTNATVWLDDDLARLGLDDFTGSVVNSSRVGVAKPDPRIYRIAAAEAGVPPGRCLFVDDTEENVAAAGACGMLGVVHRDASDLRRALADHGGLR